MMIQSQACLWADSTCADVLKGLERILLHTLLVTSVELGGNAMTLMHSTQQNLDLLRGQADRA